MDINLKLKKRRELIERQKSYQRTKIIRQYKQQVANDNDLNNLNNNLKDTNEQMKDFKKREEKRINDEKKLLGENINESDNEIKKEPKIKIKKETKEEKKENKFIGNKRNREEIEKERQKKLNKRKKNYRNLHRTNKYGQPLMKYQIQNIFDKIKKKKKEGII